MPGKFLQKYNILHRVHCGKIGHEQKAAVQWGEISRKLIKPCCTKEPWESSRASWTEHTVALELMNSVSSRDKISKFSGTRILTPSRP